MLLHLFYEPAGPRGKEEAMMATQRRGNKLQVVKRYPAFGEEGGRRPTKSGHLSPLSPPELT